MIWLVRQLLTWRIDISQNSEVHVGCHKATIRKYIESCLIIYSMYIPKADSVIYWAFDHQLHVLSVSSYTNINVSCRCRWSVWLGTNSSFSYRKPEEPKDGWKLQSEIVRRVSQKLCCVCNYTLGKRGATFYRFVQLHRCNIEYKASFSLICQVVADLLCKIGNFKWLLKTQHIIL